MVIIVWPVLCYMYPVYIRQKADTRVHSI